MASTSEALGRTPVRQRRGLSSDARLTLLVLGLLALSSLLFLQSHMTRITSSLVYKRHCSHPGCYSPGLPDDFPAKDLESGFVTGAFRLDGIDAPQGHLIQHGLPTPPAPAPGPTPQEKAERALAAALAARPDSDLGLGLGLGLGAQANPALDHGNTEEDLDPLEAHVEGEEAVRRHLREFNISLDDDFLNFDQLRDRTGPYCPPLRHCSLKTRDNFFLRGGNWRSLAGTPSSEEELLVFNPFDCWMYEFTGAERWLTPALEERVVLLVDAKDNRLFERAASLRGMLMSRVKAAAPRTIEQEDALAAELSAAVHAARRRHSVPCSITVVFNWRADPGAEAAMARLLLRTAARLPGEGAVRVVWASRPFEGTAEALETIEANEAMRHAVQEHARSGSLMVQRDAEGAAAAVPSLSGLVVGFDQLVPSLREYAVVDLRAGASDFDDPLASAGSVRLSLEELQAGWVPAFHDNAKLLVLCESGAASMEGARLLRQFGFARAVAVKGGLEGAKAAQGSEGLAAAFRGGAVAMRKESIELVGLDLFAPSLTAPEGVLETADNPLMAHFTANAVLNLAFQREVVGSALLGRDVHVCRDHERCSSCFLSHSQVPSSRLSPELFRQYLAVWRVPTVITLRDDQRIWTGTWMTFLEKNRNKQLSVRRNYETVGSRKFASQSLEKYLLEAQIVRRLPKGGFAVVQASDETAGLPKYAGNNKLNQQLMQSFEFKYPEWYEVRKLQRPSMWLGPRGSYSALHVDHKNDGNLAYQILGEKKWHLFPPRVQPWVYDRRIGVVNWSKITNPLAFTSQQAEQFPLFKLALAHTIEVDVKEGQLLYNPDGYFHAVYNTESSLMLNFWVKKPLDQAAAAAKRT